MPVLMWQVRDDAWTKNLQDAQYTFDRLGSEDKEMVWIEDTTRRFRNPAILLRGALRRSPSFRTRVMKDGGGEDDRSPLALCPLATQNRTLFFDKIGSESGRKTSRFRLGNKP